MAPDGSFVIYTARRGAGTELWWRSLLTAEARPISGTAGAHGPVLSASGDRVAFIADQRLKVVPVSSGPAIELAQVGEDEGIEWPVEDGILVATETGQVIQWLSPAGGAPRQDSLPSCWTPAWLGQRRYLCTTGQNDVFTGGGRHRASRRRGRGG